MQVKPILFSTPMVRALLAGRKTQTRRVIKPQPLVEKNMWQFYPKSPFSRAGVNIPLNISDMSPYGKAGDLLWVRETFLISYDIEECGAHYYRADKSDEEYVTKHKKDYPKWKPSIFMPRDSSRITLEITHLKVERLQDIDESDALWEGYPGGAPFGATQMWYRALWEQINGAGSWDANPWVWALTFKVIHSNINDVLAKDTAK